MKTTTKIIWIIIAMAAFSFSLFSFFGKKKKERSNVIIHENFQSKYVNPRNVEVWLPPGYDPDVSYDVVYMHDGQNVFNPETSYTGIAWEMDSTMLRLLKKNKIRPAIVVGIWNTPKRFQEYMPNEPNEEIYTRTKNEDGTPQVLSDNYLSFIVNELKPFIDLSYSTKRDAQSTFIMGSSMGGLISLYAIIKYPDVFGGAGCVSTHWPALDGVFIDYLAGNLPNPATHKIYFDYGTVNLDSLYKPFQDRVDLIMEAAGYERGKNWITIGFEGHDHNEAYWRDRLHIPTKFLLGIE